MPFDAIMQLSKQEAARLIHENSEFRVYRLTESHKESLNNTLRKDAKTDQFSDGIFINTGRQ